MITEIKTFLIIIISVVIFNKKEFIQYKYLFPSKNKIYITKLLSVFVYTKTLSHQFC